LIKLLDVEDLARVNQGTRVEIYPSNDVMWRDVQVAYIVLARSDVDVSYKTFLAEVYK